TSGTPIKTWPWPPSSAWSPCAPSPSSTGSSTKTSATNSAKASSYRMATNPWEKSAWPNYAATAAPRPDRSPSDDPRPHSPSVAQKSVQFAAMHKTVVINAVGLSPGLLSAQGTPRLAALRDAGAMAAIESVMPAVTTSVQSTYLTGKWPAEHGVVGNGWYFRDTAEVRFWLQSNK